MSIELPVTLIDGVTNPAERMSGMFEKMGDLFKDLTGGVGSGSDSMVESLGRMIMPAQQGRDELGHFTEAIGPLDGALEGLAGPAAIAVGAFAAVGAAVAAFIVEGMQASIEASELKEKLSATLEGLTGSAEGAQATIKAMDDLGVATGMTRAQLTPMAEQLAGIGFAGDALSDQLKSLASIQALGITSTDTYLTILNKVSQHLPVATKSLADLGKMGVSVADIAGEMGESVSALEQQLKKGTVNATAFDAALSKLVQAKGAKALEAQALSLDNQLARFKENISHLFEDVDTSGFMKGLQSVLVLFDQSTASGKAMKAAITGIFNAIFKVAQMVWPWIKKAIEYVVIAGLKVYIAFKPVVKAFQDLGSTGGDLDWLAGFKITLGMIVTMAQNVASSIMFIIRAVVAVENAFNHAKSAATDLIDGLVNGIKGGAGAVWDAIKGMAEGAMKTLKGILGISSPSKVFAGFGMHVGSGFAQGISAANDNVADAAKGMGGAASGAVVAGMGAPANTNAGGGGGKAGKHGGITVTFAPGSIVINGAGKIAEELSEAMLAAALERIALSQGLATGT